MDVPDSQYEYDNNDISSIDNAAYRQVKTQENDLVKPRVNFENKEETTN